MIKRPLNSGFSEKVLARVKFTTIRDNPWPIGVPVMLYNWTGAAYRSKQADVAPVVVEEIHPIGISRGDDGDVTFTIAGIAGVPLWQAEGFGSREEMNAWFSRSLKAGETVIKHLMKFRLEGGAA